MEDELALAGLLSRLLDLARPPGGEIHERRVEVLVGVELHPHPALPCDGPRANLLQILDELSCGLVQLLTGGGLDPPRQTQRQDQAEHDDHDEHLDQRMAVPVTCRSWHIRSPFHL